MDLVLESDFNEVEVGINEDVNGEEEGDGNSVEMEGTIVDENEIGGSSVEGGPSQDLNMNNEVSETDIPVGESLEEPYVGQEFECEAAAHAFYNTYATRVGFIMRVNKSSRSQRDKTIIGRSLVCNREGFKLAGKGEPVIRPRADFRVGCKAMILVKKANSGKWVVTKFVKEHAHPLTPGKGRKNRIVNQFPTEQDKIRDLSQQLAIEKKRSATYKKHLEMVFEHIDEHNLSLSRRIQGIVESVKVLKEFEAGEKESDR